MSGRAEHGLGRDDTDPVDRSDRLDEPLDDRPGRTSTTNRPVDSANSAVAGSGWGSDSHGDPESAGDAQLGQGHGEAALADVVAGPDEAGPHRGVEAAVPRRRLRVGLRGRADGRRRPARRRRGRDGCRRTRPGCRRATTTTSPGSTSSGVTQRPASGTWATAVMTSVGGTACRRPSAPVYSLFSESLPETNGARWATAASWQPVDRGDQLAERGRAARVAPREVVEQGDPVRIGTDGDDVADRLVDGGVGHRLRIVQPVPRVDADADGEPVGVARVGDHDAVGRRVLAHADERPHHRAPADLVVVAVDRRRLGRDVAVGEQRQKRLRRVGDHPPSRPAVRGRAARPPSAGGAGRGAGTRWSDRRRRRRRGGRRGGRRR